MKRLTLNINLLGIKAQSKNDLYRLLTTESDMYFLPYKETSIYSVCDIFHGRKKVLMFLINFNV